MTSRANPSEVLAAFAAHYKKYRDFKEVPILERLILLVIGRETDPEKMDPVLDKLKSDFVDWNEVRLARIDDIRNLISAAGVPDPESRGLRLRELLSKVFTERHMLSAEFLRDEDNKENRAGFLAGLPGMDYPMVQALECSLQLEKNEFPLSNHAQRVGQRLNWFARGNAFTVTKAKKTMEDIADGDLVNLTYAMVRVAEDYCHSRSPNCPSCFLITLCPTGKKFGKEKDPNAKDEIEEERIN
ncbi:MAG: hypothetical protein ACKVS6_11110 [Planctomycetota bacterium]